MNLVRNPSFEDGHFGYAVPLGGAVHMYSNSGKRGKGRTRLGNFSARMQVPTISMVSKSPTLVLFSQTIIPDTNSGKRHVVFSANSRIERLSSGDWRVQLDVTFSNGEIMSLGEEFDMEVPFEKWQNRVLSVCIGPGVVVEKIEVFGALETYRGAVYWDDWAVVLF
jgi:hypothetical protein